jgi:DNA-binding transcriptional LysR family regulator
MDRSLLPHLPIVLAVARTRSFARAASELGLGASAVSHAVRTMEERLGAALFLRTTRTVSLTEAGAAFLESAARTMEDLGVAVERLREGERGVTGLLRINSPRVALAVITPILAAMARRHPHLTVEIVADDALTDVVAAGFDAGIRLGEMIAQDMVAIRLTPPCRAIMVASPAYLAGRTAPRSIADLAAHNCIGFRLLASGAVYAWDLQENGKDIQVEVSGTIRVSDPTYARDLALAGFGIAYGLDLLFAADIEAGHLVEVLPEAAVVEPGLFLYFPRQASRSRRLQALLDMFRLHA